MVYYIQETKFYKKYKKAEDWVRKELAVIILSVFPNVRPNQITILSFLFGISASIFFGYGYLIIGAIVYYLSDVLDGTDGDIARSQNLCSPYGAYLDSSLDRYVDSFAILGIMIYLLNSFSNTPLLLFIGVSAIVGVFMQSYVTHRAESLGKVVLNTPIPLSRRMRMHLIVLASLINQQFYALIILAVLGNIIILWKLHPSWLHDFKKLKVKQKKQLPKTSFTKFNIKRKKSRLIASRKR